MNILKFIENVKKNGGCSYSIYNGTIPNSGYMVSIKGYEHRAELENIVGELRSYLLKNSDVFNSDDVYLGAWIDSDGKVCFDASENIHNKLIAIEEGMRRNQDAIYDVNKGRDIKLPKAQTTGTSYQRQTYIRMKANEIARNY